MAKCAECGLLALRHSETRELREMEADARNYGWVMASSPSAFSGSIYDPVPVCAKGFRRFTEAGDYLYPPGLDRSPNQAFLDSIGREFPCPDEGFVQRVEGLTPREHQEMLDRKFMIEREDRRDAEMRKREDDRDAEAKGRHVTDLWILGVLVAVATLLGSAMQSGWIPTPPWGHDRPIVVTVATPQSTPSTSADSLSPAPAVSPGR